MTSQLTADEPINPVHMHSGAETRWTTVNFAEALQGVQTPLSWGVWDFAMEGATRRAFGAMGILRADEVPVPARTDDRLTGMFYGRAAGNIGFFRAIGDRLPGSTSDVMEEKLFGRVSGAPTWGAPGGLRRQVAIATKLPGAALRAPRRLPGLLAEQRRWWQRCALEAPPQTLAAAQHLTLDAARRFKHVGVDHTIVTMIGPQLLEALTALAAETLGDPALGSTLATGFGGMEETAIIADMWAASRGDLTLDELRRRHGFHGPDEGRLDSRTWREETAPIEAILRSYAERGLTDPRERERSQAAQRTTVARRVLRALPPHRRPKALLMIKLASIYIPAREIGKASFLLALDGARCGARTCARVLADRGLLDDPEDVFYLTLDELTSAPSPAMLERSRQRRENHERYLGLDLPPVWTGNPVPAGHKAADVRAGATRVTGVGVVGDRVTGRARVVTDSSDTDFEPGDILVCETTDPSWTPLFMLADALVIDIGGQMSHGAIVARELGVCCVINTVTGTRDIPDRATITVDPASGAVDIIALPPQC